MTVMMDSGDDDDDDGMRNHFKVLMALSIVSRVRSHFTPLGVTDSLQSRKYPAVYKWRADVMLMLIMGIILVMSDNDDDPNDHADYDGQSKIWCFRGRNHRFFLHFYIPFLNTSKKPLCRHLTEDEFEKSRHSLAFLVRQFHYVYTGSLVRKEWPTKPLRLFALKVIRTAKFFLGTLTSNAPVFFKRAMNKGHTIYNENKIIWTNKVYLF